MKLNGLNNTSFFKKQLLIFLMLFQLSVHGQGAPPPSVNVVHAEMRLISPVSWVSGTVVSRNNSRLAAEVSGRLKKLAELGSRVKKGDIIAQIDEVSLKNIRKENAANVKSAAAKLEFLESEVKRKQTLAKKNLSAITDLDKTISLRDASHGDLIAAQARLAQSDQNLAYTRLKAPFNGIVVERLSNQGEYVENGTAIIRLVETQNLEASAFAPITAYRFLNQTLSLAIESPLGKGRAKIKSLIPVADRRSHLMEVRLDMSDFDWPVGLNIKVAVANGKAKRVLTVPRDALVLRREGMSVFIVDSKNIAQQVTVQVGMGEGGLVEIIGKVKAGDKVIIRGAERLQPGQAVSIKDNNQQLILDKSSQE